MMKDTLTSTATINRSRFLLAAGPDMVPLILADSNTAFIITVLQRISTVPGTNE